MVIYSLPNVADDQNRYGNAASSFLKERTKDGALNMLGNHWHERSTSGVADVVRVAADAQILVNAPLNAVTRAAQADVDSTMNEAISIGTTVD
jgi:hypothetical protein